MLEQEKERISMLGHLADDRPANLTGYLAERPEAMRDVIRVWGPCGCCWTYMSPSVQVITQCEPPEGGTCDFDWAQAHAALDALVAAEKAPTEKGEDGGEPPKLAIVPGPPAES